MKRMAFVAMALVGCVGDGSGGPGFTLRVAPEGPAVVVAQDGDGPWQALIPGANGVAEMEITTGNYGLLHLCLHNTYSMATAWWTTGAPAGVLPVNCGIVVETANVRGTAAPGARIWTGSHMASADDAGRFSTWARVGTRDVFAVLPGAPARFLARRGVALPDDVELELPVATEGVVMTALTPVVHGATGEVSVYSDLNNASDDYVLLGEDASVVHVPPASVLAAGDRITIGARAHGCVTQVRATETAPTLVVPAPLTATVDREQVTWTADPGVAWDQVHVQLGGRGALTFRAGATAEWLDAMGGEPRLALPDLPSLPGWPAALNPFPAGEAVTAYTSVARGEYAGDLASCLHESTPTW